MWLSRISADQRSQSRSSNSQRIESPRAGMPAQEFRGARGRAGARVQQNDIHLPPRESLVNHGQITQHQREKAEAQAAFDDGKEALECACAA